MEQFKFFYKVLLIYILFGNILSVTLAVGKKSKVDQIKSNASAKEQEDAAYEVIKRFVSSNLHNKFQILVDLSLSDNTFQACIHFPELLKK